MKDYLISLKSVRNFLFSERNQQIFIYFFACGWVVFAGFYLPESRMLFLSLLIILHAISYFLWKKKILQTFYALIFITLVIYKALIWEIKTTFFVLSAVSLIIIIVMILRKNVPKFMEDLKNDFLIIEEHWGKEFKYFLFVRKTTAILPSILWLTGSIFWDSLQSNVMLYELWLALMLYSFVWFCFFQIVTIFIIIFCNPFTQIPLSRALVFGSTAIVVGVAGFLGLHGYSTTPGCSPPLVMPGVLTYQELFGLGFQAPTSDHLLQARLHSILHPGKPPLIEGTNVVDIEQILVQREKDLEAYVKKVSRIATMEAIVTTQETIIKAYPLAKYILPSAISDEAKESLRLLEIEEQKKKDLLNSTEGESISDAKKTPPVS